MSPKVKRIVRTVLRRAVGYPLFFIACFVFFAYHTFPYARAKDAVLRKVSSQLGPGVTLEATPVATGDENRTAMKGNGLVEPIGIEPTTS